MPSHSSAARSPVPAYAYWRKCDFQVHTPRDPGWTGARPIGVGELNAAGVAASQDDVDVARLAWAESLIEACASKGLTAIAVTDHHELVMVPYVRRALASRQAVDAALDLWVFPGMELTLAGGCQCLILFDSDFPDDSGKVVQARLGISYTALDSWSSKGPPVTPLSCEYPDIQATLDALGDEVRGRYVVLPNVSQGGQHSVLKSGWHTQFLRMPYVGGYLDNGQSEVTLSSTNRTRLSGTDPMWSTRRIYPMPTSDARSFDFARLGTNNAWIKLAQPTAESIRQAFLGHKSRICISAPRTAPLTVSSLSFSGTAILEDTVFAASPELNSIIGGRGCGKSSLLEYLAFGLGRSCYDVERGNYSGSRRMQELIKDTLIAANAVVTVCVEQDGAKFVVTRGPTTAYKPRVTYPNGSTETIPEKELRALFPALAYSQGELAEIGKQSQQATKLADILQFVNPAFKIEEDRLAANVESQRAVIRQLLATLSNGWRNEAQLRQALSRQAALKERAAALEKALPAMDPTDEKATSAHRRAEEFDAKRVLASNHASEMVRGVSELEASMKRTRNLGSAIPEGAEQFAQAYQSLTDVFAAGVQRLSGELASAHAALVDAAEAWSTRRNEAKAANEEVVGRLEAHRAVADQIAGLRQEVNALTTTIGELEAEAGSNVDVASQLATAFSNLRAAADERTIRIKAWAEEIEQLSSGKIRASVEEDGDVSEIAEAIETVANKTGSQEIARTRGLGQLLATSSAWTTVERLRADCLGMLRWKEIGRELAEPPPRCEDLFLVLGDTEKIRLALEERIDLVRLQEIATATPTPRIALSYCDDQRVIAFEKASEGQRAAALLFMLLEQTGGPLIVDQPEADLDNRVIVDLSEKLHSSKRNRQIFAASHNANIVVNGSSELVIHLDIDEQGQRYMEKCGAIDVPEIRTTIASTMEGGERAFRERQDKYGY